MQITDEKNSKKIKCTTQIHADLFRRLYINHNKFNVCDRHKIARQIGHECRRQVLDRLMLDTLHLVSEIAARFQTIMGRCRNREQDVRAKKAERRHF